MSVLPVIYIIYVALFHDNAFLCWPYPYYLACKSQKRSLVELDGMIQYFFNSLFRFSHPSRQRCSSLHSDIEAIYFHESPLLINIVLVTHCQNYVKIYTYSYKTWHTNHILEKALSASVNCWSTENPARDRKSTMKTFSAFNHVVTISMGFLFPYSYDLLSFSQYMSV